MRSLLVLALLLGATGCGSGVSQLSHTGLCDGYAASATSLYKLPWAVSAAHKVSQGNCGPASHFGSQRYAYDIAMDIGTAVMAARAGVVTKVIEDKNDGNGCADGANYVAIQHADGSVAEYLHLTRNGVLVNVGALVNQGDNIALSGNTGCSSSPHLHFQVYADASLKDTIPVTFSNTTSNNRGLQANMTYTAQ